MRLFRRDRSEQPRLVVLRDSVPWTEALLIRGLLDGAGIPTSMVTLDPVNPAHTMAPPRLVRLLVYEDKHAEALSLLPE